MSEQQFQAEVMDRLKMQEYNSLLHNNELNKMNQLSQEDLKINLIYDKDTGVFTWKKSNNSKIKVGYIAGGYDSYGYKTIKINNKLFKAHRLAWLYVYGVMPINNIDHINGIKDDNRILNLRECTQQTNNYNSSIRKDNKSGIKGITFDKKSNKWRANIRVDGEQIHLGLFSHVLDAQVLMEHVREKLHGEFARFN
jgi:hypothetical protein